MRELLLDLLADLAIVATWTLAVGALAPRGPKRWFAADRGPLRLALRFGAAPSNRALLLRLTHLLPEAGAAFGGDSKRELAGNTVGHLEAHLAEGRRAEWVHWLSCLSLIGVWLAGSWLISLAISAITLLVNFTFIAVIRFNRSRINRVLERRRSD